MTGHDCGQKQRKCMNCNGVRWTKAVTKIDAMPVTSHRTAPVAGLYIIPSTMESSARR